MLSTQLSLERKSFQKSPECRERRRGGDPGRVTRSMPELMRPEMRGRQVKTGVWQDHNVGTGGRTQSLALSCVTCEIFLLTMLNREIVRIYIKDNQ